MPSTLCAVPSRAEPPRTERRCYGGTVFAGSARDTNAQAKGVTFHRASPLRATVPPVFEPARPELPPAHLLPVSAHVHREVHLQGPGQPPVAIALRNSPAHEPGCESSSHKHAARTMLRDLRQPNLCAADALRGTVPRRAAEDGLVVPWRHRFRRLSAGH